MQTVGPETQPADTVDDKDYLRTLWWHEHELMNHRLNWLGFVQTILFTAYGFSVSEALHFESYIAIGGMVTALFILISTGAAVAAQILIAKRLDRSRLGVHKITTVLGWAPPIGLPAMCILAWVILFSVFAPDTVPALPADDTTATEQAG